MNANDKEREMEAVIAEALAAVDAVVPAEEEPAAAEEEGVSEALENGEDDAPEKVDPEQLNALVDAAIASTKAPQPAPSAAPSATPKKAASKAAAPDPGPDPDLDPDLSEAERVTKALDEMKARHMRLMADFDNYRKRVQREQRSQRRFAGENALRELLDVVDNIERAVGVEQEADSAGSMREGVVMILNQMLSVLERHGVKPFTSVGETFAPERHEAVARHGHEVYDEDLVCEELQRGYMFHDRLLRPASVIVSAGKLDMSEDSASNGDVKSGAEGLD